MIKKEAVQDFLKEVEVDDLVKNIQIMGDSVFIDMVAHSPAMHEKKKLEVAMKQAFTSHFGENVTLKLKIDSPEQSEIQQNQIKGKQIPGIKILLLLLPVKEALVSLL